MASIGEDRFGDQVGIAARLGGPLAVLQGEGEKLVSLDYLRALTFPDPVARAIQIVPGAGHAAHEEAPRRSERLEEFIADLDCQRPSWVSPTSRRLAVRAGLGLMWPE